MVSVRAAPRAHGRWLRPRAAWWLVAAAGAAAAIAAIPLGYLVVRVGDAGLPVLLETLLRPRVWELALNSALLTVAVTLTCLVLGTAVGVLLGSFRLPGGPVWLLLAVAPLAVPSYLAAYGWLVLLPGINGFAPSWLVMSAVCVPYVSLPVAAVLRGASSDLEAVARTLGRGPFGAFRVATWPRVRPAATAGALLAALYTLSDFGAVAMLRYQTLTWGIKSAYGSSFDRNQAAILALVLVLLAVLVVLAERRTRRPVPAPGGRQVVSRSLTPAWLPVTVPVLLAAPLAGAAVPLAGLTLQLLRAETLRDIDPARVLSSLGVTVGLAVAGALLAALLALPIAALAARHRGRLVTLFEGAGMLGHALPGIVVGLALVFFSLSVLPNLYQTVVLLVFAYAVLFMSKAIGTTRSGLAAVPQGLLDVARTQGASAWDTWWRVTARLAGPAIGVGALLVGIAILKELPATLLLRPTGVSTLAVELWNRTSVLEYGAAAPYAAALVLIAAVPAFLLSGVRGVARERP